MATIAVIGASFAAGPAFAVEGAAPKQTIFGGGASSPFTFDEKREDPIYSPYSPYGNGAQAIYKEAGTDEKIFWAAQFNECKKRIDRVPTFLGKKTWSNIESTMRTYAYNMREAMNRQANISKDPVAARAAAATYFSDLNDISEWSVKKNVEKVSAAYDKSKVDLAAYETLLK